MIIPGLESIRYKDGRLTVEQFDPLKGRTVTKSAIVTEFIVPMDDVFRHPSGKPIRFKEDE